MISAYCFVGRNQIPEERVRRGPKSPDKVPIAAHSS